MMRAKALPLSVDKRIVVLSCRMTPDEMRLLEQLASRHALTLSETMRLALVQAQEFAQVQP